MPGGARRGEEADLAPHVGPLGEQGQQHRPDGTGRADDRQDGPVRTPRTPRAPATGTGRTGGGRHRPVPP
jgi:hypothetical protein